MFLGAINKEILFGKNVLAVLGDIVELLKGLFLKFVVYNRFV
jgi:hypothetical protein